MNKSVRALQTIFTCIPDLNVIYFCKLILKIVYIQCAMLVYSTIVKCNDCKLRKRIINFVKFYITINIMILIQTSTNNIASLSWKSMNTMS